MNITDQLISLGGNEYELFLQPTRGYYHASERKFYRKLRGDNSV